MMRPQQFAEGLTRIGLSLRQTVDAATQRVYFDSLGPQTDADEWLVFTRWCVDTDRFPTYFPKLSELRDALNEHRGGRPLSVEAGEAYERVLAAGVYSPQGGTTWTYRGVLSSCGRGAADGFLAAGGSAAFETTWDEGERRKAFLREYIAAARAEPGARLLPAASEQRALPPAEAEPTMEEANTILRRIADQAQQLEPEPARKGAA